MSLSEWGLTPTDESSGAKPHGELTDEAGLFSALELNFIPPEVREGRGEIEVADEGPLPKFVEYADLRGVFHNHTDASDGRATLEEMAEAAAALGWDYLGIADHSKASFQANGLNEDRVAGQIGKIRKFNDSGKAAVHLFAGIECDILVDGRLDLDEAILTELDYVVASVHVSLGQSEEEMTKRLIRAIEHPSTTMLGHVSGRLLLAREPAKLDHAKVIDAAAANGVIIELNANPRRLDMDWRWWRRATEKGVLCAINPDAHSTQQLEFTEAGVRVARKGWLEARHVLNTRSLKDVRTFFDNRRR
jgi:DNA polymerase (family 10)